MAKSCINYSSPEWKRVLEVTGSSADAHLVYVLNGDVVPTPEKAKVLLDEYKSLIAKGTSNYTYSDKNLTTEEKIDAYEKITAVEQESKKRMLFSSIEEAIKAKSDLVVQIDGENITPIQRFTAPDGLSVGFYFDVYHPEFKTRTDVPLTREEIRYFFKNKDSVALAVRVVDGDIQYLSILESRALINKLSARVFDTTDSLPVGEGLVKAVKSVINDEIKLLQSQGKSIAHLKFENDFIDNYSQIVKAVVQKLTRYQVAVEEIDDVDVAEETSDLGDFDREILESTTWDKLDNEVKLYLSFITYVNPRTGKEELADEQQLYNALLKAATAYRNIPLIERFERFGKYNPMIKAFVTKFKAQMLDESNTPLQSKSRFANKVFKTFEKIRLNETKILFFSDNIVVSESDIETSVLKQLKEASTEYTIRVKDQYSNEVGKNRIDDLYNKVEQAFRSNDPEKIALSLKNFFNVVGLPLSDFYLNVSTGIEEDITGKYTPVTLDVVSYIYNQIKKEKNPFVLSKEYDADLSRAKILLKQILSSNAMFDETVLEDTYNDADNKRRWSYAEENYLGRVSYNLQLADFREKLQQDENGLSENIFFNLSPEEADLLFQNLNLTLSGSIRAVENNAGVTFKTIDDSSYLLQGLALLNNFREIKIAGRTIRLVKTLPKQWEAKNTAYNIEMPWNTTLDKDGKLVEVSGFFTLDNDFNLSLNTFGRKEFERSLRYELARIQQASKVISENGQLKTDYHTGSERGTKLFGFAFLSNEVKEELETLAKQKGFQQSDIPQELLNRALNETSSMMQNNFNNFIELLKNQGIITDTIDEDGSPIFIASNISNSSLRTFLKGTPEELVNTNRVAVMQFIASYFTNSTISSLRYNEIFVGDLSTRKDFVEVTKRGGGELAFGPSAWREGYDNARVGYIKEPSRWVYIDNNKSIGKTDEDIANEVAILKERAKQIAQQLGTDPKVELKKLLAEEGLKEIENADGQGMMTIDRFINIADSHGKLTEKGKRILEKISLGIPITFEESTYLTDRELIPNSVKGVYFNRNVYHKLSYLVLTKEFTSKLKDDVKQQVEALLTQSKGEYTQEIKDIYANEENWVAKNGKQVLHNIRKSMIGKVDELVPPSASKINKIVPAESATGEFDFNDSNIDIIDNHNWRLQVKNPSGKLEITQGSQLLQLLDNEQNLDLEVVFKGQIKTVRDLRVEYQQLLNQIRHTKFIKAESYMDSNGVLDKKLLKKLRVSLSATNEDNELLEFLEELEDGSPKFNLNIPHIRSQFENMLISHMLKKTLRLKLPGLKCAVITDYGYKIVRDQNTGEVVPTHLIEANPSAYLNQDGSLKDGLIEDRLRFGVKTPSGSTLSEVAVPPYLAEMYNLKVGDNIPEELFEIFGIRIPTEDKRSMMAAKIVELLPAHMGNSIMVSSERILYSGEDYDIDSIYIYRKEVYKDANGRLRAYGTYTTEQEKFYEYLQYIRTTEEYKSAKAEFLESNDAIATEYDNLVKLEEQLIRERLGYNQVRDITSRIKDITSALNRIESDLQNASNTMIVDEKMMYLLNIQTLGSQELFDKQSILNNNREVVEAWRRLQQRKNELNAIIQDRVLSELDYPTDIDGLRDFESLGIRYNEPEMSNRLLDIMTALYTNPSVQDAARTPTDLSEMDNLASIFEDASVKVKQNAFYYSPLGTYYAWKSNKDGKFNIGPVAKSNLTIAALTRNNINLVSKYGITIDRVYHEFGTDTENDIILEKDANGRLSIVGSEIKRKFTSLANLLAAMTDNAKNQHANKLNLTYNTVGFAATMLGLGVGVSRTMLFLNQPIIKEFSKRLEEQSNPLFESKPSANSIIRELKKELLTKLGELSKEQKEAIKRGGVTTDQLLDNYNSRGADTMISLLTLLQLEKLSNITSPMITIGNILGLNKSLDDRSMIGLQKMIRSIRDLALRDPRLLLSGEVQMDFPNYWTTELINNQSINVPMFENFQNLFNIDINTIENVRRVERTNNLIKPYLINYDPFVDAILANFSTLNIDRAFEKSNAFLEQDIDLRNYIALSLINRALNIGLGAKFGAINEGQIQKELASLFPSLNSATIAAQNLKEVYQDVLAKDPSLKTNPFIATLSFDDSGVMLKVSVNTFIKKTPEVSKLIKEGYTELQRKHPEFARMLKTYLKNTTGFDYTEGSFIGNLPASEFNNLSSIITRLKKNMGDVESLAKMVLYAEEYEKFSALPSVESKMNFISRTLFRNKILQNPGLAKMFDEDSNKEGFYSYYRGEKVYIVEFVNGKPYYYDITNRGNIDNVFTGALPSSLILKLLSLGETEKAYKAAVTKTVTPDTKTVMFNNSEQSPYRFLHFGVNSPNKLVDNAGVEYNNVYSYMLGSLLIDVEDRKVLAQGSFDYRTALKIYSEIPNNKKFNSKDASFNELKEKLYLMGYNELFQANPQFKELLMQTGNAQLSLESDVNDDIKSLIVGTIQKLRAYYNTTPVIPQTKLYVPTLVKEEENSYTVAEIPGLSFDRIDDKSFRITMVGVGSNIVNAEMFSSIKTMFSFQMKDMPRYSKESISHTIANRLNVSKDLVFNALQINFKTPATTQPTQVPVSTDKFAKKNIFTVTPQQGVVDNKAAIKASIATQYIGFGEGLRGSKGQRSSSEIYREQAGKFANTGNYSANDVIFVSVPGKRGAESKRKEQQDKTINEAIKAVEAGATILTDNKAYIDASSYNTGEKRLYANMEAKGYNYSEVTVDGQVIGTWSKTTTQPTQQGNVRKTYSGKVTSLQPNQIFVFGSNEGSSKGAAPTHGAGSAKIARDNFGAVQGQSRGLQGQSYAIVTKKFYDVEKSSTPQEIIEEIKGLYEYAKQNPTKEFLVSDYSESNLNGYTGQEMADMFNAAGPIPSNIVFNENFDKLISTQPTTPTQQTGTNNNIKTISSAYGVVTLETNPTQNKTQEFVNIIQPQIQKQAYKENASGTANDMFMYGLRWTRKSTANAPLNNKSFANKGLPITDAKAKDPYVYDTLDQNGNPLAPVSDLQPIITEIENTLGIDMSNYDAVIGNIYLPDQNIATHRDTTESLSARNYPVVVYTIGNNSGISVYENEKNPGATSFASDKKTTIPTKNGTIYTFGMDGKGRFEVAHDTPKNIKRDQKFPPITLPNGTVVENYTITLTFRRAADLEPGMPTSPAKLTQQTTTSTFESSFSTERQKEILSNFAAKHKMSEEQALKYINEAINTKGEEVIKKLNECY